MLSKIARKRSKCSQDSVDSTDFKEQVANSRSSEFERHAKKKQCVPQQNIEKCPYTLNSDSEQQIVFT